MSVVTISTPSNEISGGWGTKIFTEDGNDIGNCVSAIDIRIRPDEVITATLAVATAFKDVKADAIFDLESTRTMAAAHGFFLVKKFD